MPIGPDIQYADAQPNAPLELRIFRGQNGSFTLYDDEGDNYNYEQGHFSLIRVSWDDAAGSLTLHDRQGSYPGMPSSREFRIVIEDGANKSASSDGSPTYFVRYEGREISIDF